MVAMAGTERCRGPRRAPRTLRLQPVLRILPVMHDIICEEGDQQENECSGKDRNKDEERTCVPLHSDESGCAAGGMDGAGQVHH